MSVDCIVKMCSPVAGNLISWVGDNMRDRLLLLYARACRNLAIPPISCQVERCFAICRRVRSENQHNTEHGTRKTYVSSCFNGVATPP